MSEHPNVGGIRRFYEAESTGDAATIRELFADDLVWNIPVARSRAVRARIVSPGSISSTGASSAEKCPWRVERAE